MTGYQKLTVITVVMTLVLIADGSTVRTTGSGLGCPDWPLCHGRPYPPLERTAIIEYSHRTTAAIVGVLVLVIGTYTVATNAGFACTGWPGCPEAPVPFLQGHRLQDIHWLHRLTVLLGGVAVGWVFLHVREMGEAGDGLRRGADTLLG